MHTLTVIRGPIRDGWAITLSDGRQMARFTGLGAKRRALRYLASHNVLKEARAVEQRAEPFALEVTGEARVADSADQPRQRHHDAGVVGSYIRHLGRQLRSPHSTSEDRRRRGLR